MKLPLRVLHVIPSISPSRGGPSTAILAMVRALNENGVSAEIATTNDDGLGVRDVPLSRLIDVDGVPVRFFHRYSPPVRAAREFAFANGFRDWLRSDLRHYDSVHVHALFSFVSTSAMCLARRAGVPYIARPSGLLGAWPLRQSALRKILYLRAIEATNLRRAAAVHFTSTVERDEAAQLNLGLRSMVIPHGVDLPVLIPDAKRRLRLKLQLPLTQKLILFLGRLHRKKGLDLLLAALAELPDTHLVLAGRGEPKFERELESMIREAGMEARVSKVGHVEGHEKHLLLQGANLFALTSRHENFGMAVVEALAAGAPVLVSDQVALSGDVAKFQLGEVAVLDARAISAALARMLSPKAEFDPARLRKFVAERYSWKTAASDLSALYHSIASDSRRLP